jgi:hypothetical protein
MVFRFFELSRGTDMSPEEDRCIVPFSSFLAGWRESIHGWSDTEIPGFLSNVDVIQRTLHTAKDVLRMPFTCRTVDYF